MCFHYCSCKASKKNGIKKLKSGSLPAKVDSVQQKEFYDKVLSPLFVRAEKGTETLLFLDASHFVMGGDFLGCFYGKTRRFIKSFSGRMRYNVLGAIDFATKEVLTVTNTTYITATQVCEMLQKISATYKNKTVSIVLDNARYQKCKVVQELADHLHISLVYLPPYSPNLNLIERLWKFVKGELRKQYYHDFTQFQQKIDTIIDSTPKINKEKISQLISKEVALFDDLKEICPNTFVPTKPRRKKTKNSKSVV